MRNELLNDIIDQLEENKYFFQIIYSLEINKSKEKKELLTKVVELWKSIFIEKRKVPYVDQYLWHVFSYKMKKHLEKDKALNELKSQFPTKTYIFNETLTYLIECSDCVPIIELRNFMDDVYICHHNMKWTYVLPHEMPEIGPFFAIKN